MSATISDTPLDLPRSATKPAAEVGEAASGEKRHRGLFGPDGFSFGALLDAINPLQHIPIVSTIYRAITGDKIEAGPRMIGGAIFGGPIGFVASMVNAMIEEATGKDVGDHVLAVAGIDLGGDKPQENVGPVLAAAPPAEAAQEAAAQPIQLPPDMLAAMQPQAPAFRSAALPDRVLAKTDPRADTAPATLKGKLAANSDVYAALSAAAQGTAPAESKAESKAWPKAGLAAPSPASAQANTQPAVAQSVAANPGLTVGEAADDGRKWFAAFPQNGGVQTRAVGAQTVTPQTVTQKFGVKGSAYRQPVQPHADWAERASAAYQKFMDMKHGGDKASALDQRY